MRTPYQNLTESFPELNEAFHHLKAANPHFQQLLKHYEALEAVVHKVDHKQEVMSDFELEKVKKQRVVLKDNLYTLMTKYATQIQEAS